MASNIYILKTKDGLFSQPMSLSIDDTAIYMRVYEEGTLYSDVKSRQYKYKGLNVTSLDFGVFKVLEEI